MPALTEMHSWLAEQVVAASATLVSQRGRRRRWRDCDSPSQGSGVQANPPVPKLARSPVVAEGQSTALQPTAAAVAVVAAGCRRRRVPPAR